MEILNNGCTQAERSMPFYIYYFMSNNFYYVGDFSAWNAKLES